MFDSLKNATRIALLWSGGLDSTLLLAMMKDLEFDIVQFGREFWTKEQKKRADLLMRKWDLKVLSYPSSSVSFIGENDQISLVREYAFMGAMIPMVSDAIEGSRCIADLDSFKCYAPPMKWSHIVLGSRSEDRHYAFAGQVIPSSEWTVGETTFVAPLFDWTRKEVQDELELRGLPFDEAPEYADSGNLSLCTKCLKGVDTFCPKENSVIPPVQWNPATNLAAFRAAYA